MHVWQRKLKQRWFQIILERLCSVHHSQKTVFAACFFLFITAMVNGLPVAMQLSYAAHSFTLKDYQQEFLGAIQIPPNQF
jgi:hypothetical protein